MRATSHLYPRPAGTLTAVGALKLVGRGRPEPLLDENGRLVPGSISEKAFADINGVRQGMFIQSKNPAHPVLLCLHGGLPEHFLTERHPTDLENDFTVVWWEQRGAGLSYSPRIPPQTMMVEQFMADTMSVTGYLRDRLRIAAATRDALQRDEAAEQVRGGEPGSRGSQRGEPA